VAPLEEAPFSFDSNVILDFHLTGNYAFLESVAAGRMLISDFVEDELSGSDRTPLPAGSEVVALTTEPELDFFHQIERAYRNLGVGELGAITVAKFRSAVFVSNDGNARAAAKDLGLELTGGLGLLQLGVSLGHIQGPDGIRIMEDMVLNGAWFSDELIELFRQSVLKN
jgi:predicted nucleic acid-binding protein